MGTEAGAEMRTMPMLVVVVLVQQRLCTKTQLFCVERVKIIKMRVYSVCVCVIKFTECVFVYGKLNMTLVS